MPMKGWVSLSVREETAEILEELSQKTGKTISALLSEVAPLLSSLHLIKTIKDEVLKIHLAETLYHIESFLNFYRSITEESKKKSKTTYLTYALLPFMVSDKKDLHEKLQTIFVKAILERRKLTFILNKVGKDPEPAPSFPLIPIPEVYKLDGSPELRVEGAWFTLHNLIESRFSSGKSFLNAYKNLEVFTEAIPELKITASLLKDIADWFSLLMEVLEEKLPALKKRQEPFEPPSSQDP